MEKENKNLNLVNLQYKVIFSALFNLKNESFSGNTN